MVCKISPFFQGACNSLFKEALSGEIYLPEADPQAFDIFMDWMYTRLINFPGHPPKKESIGEIKAWWILAAKMYVLAHYLQCTTFGNAVIDLICRSLTNEHILRGPHNDVIDLVYNSTFGDCGLRKLLVAMSVWWTASDLWKEGKDCKTSLEGLPAEYSHDLVFQLQRRNHKLDQDPFVNEETCQIFRDAELGWQAIKG